MTTYDHNEILDGVDEELPEIEISFDPNSLADLVEDMKADGFSDEDIALRLENIKKEIKAEFQQHIQDGTIDDMIQVDDDNCNDPDCTNCFPVLTTYH